MRLFKKLLLGLSLIFGFPNNSTTQQYWVQPSQVVRPSIDNVSAVDTLALLVRRPVQGGWGIHVLHL